MKLKKKTRKKKRPVKLEKKKKKINVIMSYEMLKTKAR